MSMHLADLFTVIVLTYIDSSDSFLVFFYYIMYLFVYQLFCLVFEW